MRNSLVLLLILPFLANGQEISDTNFLYREVNSDYYHAIYIDTSDTCQRFQWLTSFEFDDYDQQSYKVNVDFFKEESIHQFKTANQTNLPKNWIPVYEYKGKRYIYAPSDWGNAGRRVLNDSAFVFWYMDGPTPCPLESAKQIDERAYQINYYQNTLQKSPSTLTIQILDPHTMLSVFEYDEEPERYRYQLYVPAENAHHYDLVINYCNMMKTAEFQFDEISTTKWDKGK